MFQPAGEGTPSRASNRDKFDESTILRKAVRDIKRIADKERVSGIVVHSNPMHINAIGKRLGFDGRICPWGNAESNVINMVGWHQFPSVLPEGFQEGSDEIMLALYKINEVVFNAITLYPYKILNAESGKFDYKKNSFMRFILHEGNKHDKIFSESGFYRSTIDYILQYYDEYTRIQLDESASTKDIDLFVFAMLYDFMSYVAQTLEGYQARGISLEVTRSQLIEVINKCEVKFTHSVLVVSRAMISIVKESIPELNYIKDFNSDFQVQRSVTWEEYTNKKNLSALDVKDILVDNMNANDPYVPTQLLRRGANALQGLISSSKRKRNRIAITPHGLQKINEMDNSSDENTEGSESASPAFDPTSPPYSVETTESSGKARIQGQGTALDFTPVREPEPAVDSDSENRTDMSMFIVPVAMISAQIAHSNWMVDLGAGMSRTGSTTNLIDTMRCKIPITPAFGAVMNAKSEGLISDPILKELGIKAILFEGMHHNLLSVHQVCTVGEFGEEGCQFFSLSKFRGALKIMSKCNNTSYGLVNGGVYVYAPAGPMK